MPPVRFLSYNIHKGIGGRDRRYRLRRVIDVIEAARPDVVCLQEVDRHVRRSRFDDQPRLLAERLGMTPLYQLNVPLRTRDRAARTRRHGGYGNLILARPPVLEWHQIGLRVGLRKPRGAVVAVLDTPAGPLRLVNWHLGLAEGERHRQVARLLGHELFRGGPLQEGGPGDTRLDDLPTLLIGDTNDWRNRLAGAALGDHGFTPLADPPAAHRTFPAWLPRMALDKAFARGLRADSVTIPESPPARDASDHLPLVVDCVPG